MEDLQGKRACKWNRNGPPSANQGFCTSEPRHNHAVCTLRVHPPTSLCPALSAHAEPKSQGHCWKWQWSWKSHDIIWSHWVGKGLTTVTSLRMCHSQVKILKLRALIWSLNPCSACIWGNRQWWVSGAIETLLDQSIFGPVIISDARHSANVNQDTCSDTSLCRSICV